MSDFGLKNLERERERESIATVVQKEEYKDYEDYGAGVISISLSRWDAHRRIKPP